MNKKTVLIVDDDADILMSLKAVLETKDHSVETAGDSAAAMKIFSAVKPDVVILDLMMEKVDAGLVLCKEMRKIDNTARIYLLSAVGDETAATINLADYGFNGALSKPIKPEELIALVG